MASDKVGSLVSLSGVNNELIKYEENKNENKLKRKILDEDEYIEKLEAIIERDFFPDLSKLKETLVYQEAIEKNDYDKLNELREKYLISNKNKININQQQSSPIGFETPLVDQQNCKNNDDNNKNVINRDDDKNIENLSLNKFLSKYTSEDNLSFEVIIKEAKKRHQEKYPWLYIDENKEAERLKESLALPSIEENDKNKNVNMLTWAYKNKNCIMYYPEGCKLSKNEIIEKKRLKQKEICYENTRFKNNPFISSNNTPTNSSNNNDTDLMKAKSNFIKFGIDGKEVHPHDVNVNGFNLVSMSPSPSQAIMNTPLMTWGCIENTPLHIDGNQTPLISSIPTGTPQFRIPDTPKREQLAHQLSDKFSKQNQHKKLKNDILSKKISSPLTPSFANSPRTPSERLTLMSPAAQRLVKSNLGISLAADKELRQSYSPSPLRLSTPSSLSSIKTSNSEKSSVITNRLKASDFF